jgi:hypothetical protein
MYEKIEFCNLCEDVNTYMKTLMGYAGRMETGDRRCQRAGNLKSEETEGSN